MSGFAAPSPGSGECPEGETGTHARPGADDVAWLPSERRGRLYAGERVLVRWDPARGRAPTESELIARAGGPFGGRVESRSYVGPGTALVVAYND